MAGHNDEKNCVYQEASRDVVFRTGKPERPLSSSEARGPQALTSP